MHDRIGEIIKEELNKLILQEEKSISTIVLNCAETIGNDLTELYRNDKYNYIDKKKIIVRVGNNDFKGSFTDIKTFIYKPNETVKQHIPNLNEIHVKVIELNNEDTYRINYDYIDVGGGYSLETKNISISIPSFDGGMRVAHLKNVLKHELEHAYQFSLGHQKDDKNLLSNANRYLNSYDKIVRAVARMLYFFDTLEINANIQQFYDDLNLFRIKNRNELHKTELFSERKIYMDKFYNFLIKCNQEELEYKLKNNFGVNKEFFFSYLEKQFKYMNAKIMKAYQLYLDRNSIKDIMVMNENNNFFPR